MHHIDLIAAEQRQAEIAKVMARMEAQKQRLGRMLDSGVLSEAELNAVSSFNESTNPFLAKHWAAFMAMDVSQQQAALLEPRHDGMHWQSLMQCNPFAITGAWRQAA